MTLTGAVPALSDGKMTSCSEYLISIMLHQQVRASQLHWNSTTIVQVPMCLAKHPYSE